MYILDFEGRGARPLWNSGVAHLSVLLAQAASTSWSGSERRWQREGSQSWVMASSPPHPHVPGTKRSCPNLVSRSKVVFWLAVSNYHAIQSLWLLREEKVYVKDISPSCCVTDITAVCLYIQPLLLFSWQIWFVAFNIFKVMLLLIVVMLLIFIKAFYYK